MTSSENNNYGGVRYLPYVLTEYGITMLAGLLKSNIAVKVNIYIIKAFVKMRHNIIFNKDLFPHKFMLLENKVDDNTKRINELFDRFIILDRNYLYICGASFKDLGKKCFYIGEFSDIEYLNKLLSIINL